MNTYEANPVSGQKRMPRLWIVETLVVLGIIAFGYFAITLDAARWTGAEAAAEPAHPLAELIR